MRGEGNRWYLLFNLLKESWVLIAVVHSEVNAVEFAFLPDILLKARKVRNIIQ